MKLNIFSILPVVATLTACGPNLAFENTKPEANVPPTSAPQTIATNEFEVSDEVPTIEPSHLEEEITQYKTAAAPVTTKEVKEQIVPTYEPTIDEEFEQEAANLLNPETAVEEDIDTIDVEEFTPIAPITPPQPKPTKLPKPKVIHNAESTPLITPLVKSDTVAVTKVKAEPPSLPIVTESTLNSETELFEQSQPKIDILFVIDNSPSMKREQKKLGERLQAFLKSIKHTDWQMAFTTTDVSNGKYGLKGSLLDLHNHNGTKILNSNFSDAEEVFYNTVQRSEGDKCIFNCPSSNEQPLKASVLALEKSKGENSIFFRPGADLAIVILTDEDEMSSGSRKATKPQDVVNTFKEQFGDTKELAVYGIVIQPNDKNCFEDQKTEGFSNANPGRVVTQLARLTNGFTGSICDQDYSVALENISDRTRYIAESYRLKRTPIAESVKVTLSPEQNVEWKIEDNHLSFIEPPKEGTKVSVSYNFQ